MEDTIAILRGLKERYEVHHGVRIQDAALVAAAVLSDRYVTGRFLPDKAIDLMDEAASRLRIEIDSMPTELDVVTRRMRQLEIERMALAKETDSASAERLARLDEEMANLQEESVAMTAHWQSEKEAITTIQSLKGELEQPAGRGRAPGPRRRPGPGGRDPLRGHPRPRAPDRGGHRTPSTSCRRPSAS